jgi:predicted transposase/invertase (TIGR01784 family)
LTPAVPTKEYDNSTLYIFWTHIRERGKIQRNKFRRKREADHQAILSQKLDEGIAIGRAEGLREGEEKGKINIARRLLAKYPPEAVAEMTGLTLQQVEQLLLPK